MWRWISTRLLPVVPIGLAALPAGCTLERPEGAFDPVYEDGGSGGGAWPGLDAGEDVYMPPIVLTPEDDGGGPTGGDAGPVVVDPRLAELPGTYLVRFDQYSSGSTSSGITSISVDTRASFFALAELSVTSSGALQTSEVVCRQSFLQACRRGCSSAQTQVNPNVDPRFASTPPVRRALTLEGTKLSGGDLTMYLGFDAAGGSTSLPTSTSDARVWDLDGKAPGEGVLTHAKVTTPIGSAECWLNTVQALRSKWNIGLKDAGGVLKLEGSGTLDLTGSRVERIGATGAGLVDASQCRNQSGEGSAGREVVRFAKATQKWTTCPTVNDFERLVPAEGL